jgi:hypothetical protein
VKAPPLKTQGYGFGELFASIHYVEYGYDVFYCYGMGAMGVSSLF